MKLCYSVCASMIIGFCVVVANVYIASIILAFVTLCCYYNLRIVIEFLEIAISHQECWASLLPSGVAIRFVPMLSGLIIK